MKIVFALDSFKGSMSSLEAGEACRQGALSVLPDADTVVVPVADGGEGTVEALTLSLGGEIVEATVSGPLGEPVDACYGLSGDTAVIEVAAASGLTLIPVQRRNPWLTTSFGTGQLIRDAIYRGCRRFLIGLGGSATNDAGVGMLQALGYRFLDVSGKEVGRGGGEVGRIATIDTSRVIPELKDCEFRVACDVTNPLCGRHGASHIFAPQKGAGPAMIEKLDAALGSFASVAGSEMADYPGAGAAGGLGFAFLTFLDATLLPGIEMVLDAIDFDERIKGARLIFTGEGRLDAQTCMGKAPSGVLKRALRQRIPVIALGGSLDPEALPQLIEAGFTAAFPIVAAPCSLAEAMQPATATANLSRTVAQILTLNPLSHPFQ